MSACKTARISAVFCGENVGRKDIESKGANRCVIMPPPCGSGGPIIVTTSGKTASSVENVRNNCSKRDLRGSTFVGDRHESNTDFNGCCISADCCSADKLSDCFFLLLGVLLVARKSLFRRSTIGSFSRGGLLVADATVAFTVETCCGSEYCPSGSVLPAAPSLPELSFFQSRLFSTSIRKEQMQENGN